MATSDSRSGDTMIVQHNPLICGQSVGYQIYTSGSKPSRPCTLSLTHTISLPEKENLSNEALNDDIQARTSKSSYNKREGILDLGSEKTRRYSPTSLHCHNLFVLGLKVNETEENCNIFANNLHKYCKDYPFCQYENSNRTKDQSLRYTKKSCCSQCIISTTTCNHNIKHVDHSGGVKDDQRNLPNYKDTPILMDCEEQDWANAISDCESINQHYADYFSDSSCNSSDGVLVNFSAIYNKANNAVPATPYDLDSPVKQAQAFDFNHQDDDIKLIPCWSSCESDPNCNIYQANVNGLSSQETSDLTPCQGHLTTYTNSYYKLVTCDLSSQSVASPAWSSLTSCPEDRSPRSMTPHTEYFFFRKPETEDRDGDIIQSNLQANEDTHLTRSKRTTDTSKKTNDRKTHHDKHKDHQLHSHEHISTTQVFQSWNKYPWYSLPEQEGLRRVLSCPGQINLSKHVLKPNKTSFAELACYKKSQSLVKNSKFPNNISPFQMEASLGQTKTLNISQNKKESGGSWSSKTAAIPTLEVSEPCTKIGINTKPQRPTSLAIQPFVLQPPSEKQTSNPGSLIDQYISHKHSASKSSDPPSDLTRSQLDICTSILEVASCSTTCSTCTPTSTEPHVWSHWNPPRPLIFLADPDSSTKTVASLPDKTPREYYTCLNRTRPTLSSCTTDQEKIDLKTFSSQQLHEQHGPYQNCLAADPRITRTPFIPPDAGQNNSYIQKTQKLPFFLKKEQQTHDDSSSLADRPPEEFCSSPDPSTIFHPIDLLQRKDLLKSLSVAVDLITAHFSSCTDPDEKFRLGNSSVCPRIGQLVLDELCPAFQNILQDGLKPFKLDLIVGRRSNKPWSVVEASTQPGPSTRMLHSLVSVVKKCSKLTNHIMRLNAFFLGLLNLSALDLWFWHLHTCVEVIAEYYHPWALLALSQDPVYKSLFQELLLMLQPLSELPFDLHLLSESRLERRQVQNQLFIQPSSFFSGYTVLKTHTRQNSNRQLERSKLKEKREPSRSSNIHKILQGCGVGVSRQSTRQAEPESSVCLKKKSPGWWLSIDTDHVMDAERSVAYERDDVRRKEELSVRNFEEKMELRWARLFGSGNCSPVKVENSQQNIKQIQRIR
ncbi:Iporin [Bagarius yarrelli]|uniref:Iporin n=1 Tax=Bagarius yarrelli TaxID=175774 RepID=A0A556U2M0_BAGYA|nr:Iporin [Bagarius yarrelli]